MHHSSPTFDTSTNHFYRSTFCIISSSTKLAAEGCELAIKWCTAIRGGPSAHIKALMVCGSVVRRRFHTLWRNQRPSFQVRVLFIPGIYLKRLNIYDRTIICQLHHSPPNNLILSNCVLTPSILAVVWCGWNTKSYSTI